MSKRMSNQEVKEYFEKFGYELLDNYKNNRTPLKIRCPKGHMTNSMTYGNFKKGQRCKHCGKEKIGDMFRTSFDKIREYVESFNYKILSEEKEYKNANDSVLTFQCEHNHKPYKTTYSAFKNQGNRCPQCANEHRNDNRKLDYEYVKTELNKYGYELLSTKYNNAHEKLEVICPNGHKYKTDFNNFQQGKRCARCNESKGEKKIAEILYNLNIDYMTQHRFDDCKCKRALPFDFYLPQYNCCIEYDGEQHYKIINFFGGLDGFIERKINDNIKNIYCDNNNINLIRIPEWDFDKIEEILKRELK